MSETDQQRSEIESAVPRPRPAEEDFVRYLARWALLVSALIVFFDVAVVRNYPFPGFLGDTLRGLFYTGISLLLAAASIFLVFLGYRIVTLRYARRTKALYIIFLPAVLFVTSIFWFIVLAK